jgi:hypothetical protein
VLLEVFVQYGREVVSEDGSKVGLIHISCDHLAECSVEQRSRVFSLSEAPCSERQCNFSAMWLWRPTPVVVHTALLRNVGALWEHQANPRFEWAKPGQICSMISMYYNEVVAGGPGFEPGLRGPEPRVLPLNYPPMRREAAFYHTDDICE